LKFGVAADHEHYRWWALSCTSLGMLLAATNSGTLIIALPDLERSLHTGLLTLVWVILAYMIASTALVITVGRLSDLFGRKRAYVLGFLVFSLASLGAGFSGSGTELILWRIVQGIGAASLFANSAALVTDAFPKEQLGLAMGTNTMVAAVGLVLGPVLGGALVEISWHWVFWFNVPFGLLGCVWAGTILRELIRPESVKGLDIPGGALLIVGLSGLTFGISRGSLSGWGDGATIIGLAVGLVLLPIFLFVERRGTAPMLDLEIFRDRLFSAAAAAAFLNGLARFALMFVFVFYYQGAQGDGPVLAGIKLAPLALGMLIASPIAGVWADRHGSRTLATAGMALTGLGLGLMTMLQVDTGYFEGAVFLFVVGVGSGMFNSPNTSAMMGAVEPHQRGVAAATRVLAQNTGAVMSIALVMALITAGIDKDTLFKIFSGISSGLDQQTLDPFISNMHTALWVLTATAIVGVFVCALRPAHVKPGVLVEA
jgi:EmrB/QacA subfamily drug resistance transporter